MSFDSHDTLKTFPPLEPTIIQEQQLAFADDSAVQAMWGLPAGARRSVLGGALFKLLDNDESGEVYVLYVPGVSLYLCGCSCPLQFVPCVFSRCGCWRRRVTSLLRLLSFTNKHKIELDKVLCLFYIPTSCALVRLVLERPSPFCHRFSSCGFARPIRAQHDRSNLSVLCNLLAYRTTRT